MRVRRYVVPTAIILLGYYWLSYNFIYSTQTIKQNDKINQTSTKSILHTLLRKDSSFKMFKWLQKTPMLHVTTPEYKSPFSNVKYVYVVCNLLRKNLKQQSHCNWHVITTYGSWNQHANMRHLDTVNQKNCILYMKTMKTFTSSCKCVIWYDLKTAG